MSNNNILFDANSGAMDSPVFMLDKQITVIATGMAPDDFITFEVLQLLSGDPIKLCGCRLTAASMATIELVKPLTCSMCGPEVNSQEVRLTDNNTFVILDTPQGALLRAIYHGTGVDDGTAKVWYNTTDTQDLNDAMRGCAPVEVWEDNGETRCNLIDQIIEIQQSSSCGGIRWVNGPALMWVETGEVRCNITLSILEMQEVNDCGDLRWVAGAPFAWVNTGLQDCTDPDGFVRVQQVSPCGDLQWVPGAAVEWLPTGELICDDVNVNRQERSQCGDIRLISIGAVELVDTGLQSCEWIPVVNPSDIPYYTMRNQQINSCGVTSWSAISDPIAGTQTGNLQCHPGEDLIFYAEFTNPCGNIVLQPNFVNPGEFWVRTGAISCGAGEIILLEERNPCGGSRWVEDPMGTPAWHDAGGDCSYSCDPDTGFLFRIQQSSCCEGNTRLVPVTTGGSEPVPALPEWLSTGTFRCNSDTGFVEVQERSQCNDYRWTSCSPISWQATGETRIFNGVSQIQTVNACGEFLWQDIPPESITWTLTGVQACVGGFYQNQETDGFGNVRTVATTEPCGCGDPILTSEYDSGWVLYTGRRSHAGFVTTQHTLLHGLGVVPEFVTMEYRCEVAEGGYTIGDIVVANVHAADQQNGASTGWSMIIDNLNINLAFDYNNGASLHEWNGNNNFRLNNTNWSFRIRGYA